MIDLFDSIARLEKLLDYHLQRHAVLSANVANVETPGYVSRDLRFADALDEATAGMAKTDARHLPAPDGPAANVTVFDDPVPGRDRGAVLEREMAKVAANSVRYEMAAELVRRRLALLRYAASDGGGG
jgi:flagellar basal-body rod protein FlgB